MPEIIKKFKEGAFTLKQWQNYQEWLHCEDVLQEEVREKYEATLEDEWHKRFADAKHHDMCTTPHFLSQERHTDQKPTVADGKDLRGDVATDGKAYKDRYFTYVQGIFSRLQHHMHKKTKHGYVPVSYTHLTLPTIYSV